jgi:hypothetical protein
MIDEAAMNNNGQSARICLWFRPSQFSHLVAIIYNDIYIYTIIYIYDYMGVDLKVPVPVPIVYYKGRQY